MGCGVGFQIPHMILFCFSFVITFLFMLLHSTCTTSAAAAAAHIVISDSSSPLAIIAEHGAMKERLSVATFSGVVVAEDPKKHGVWLDNFRVLLGLDSFKRKNPKAQPPTRAPAPSPIPVYVPAPAPVARNHVHSHRSPLQSRHPKLQEEIQDKQPSKHGNVRVILVATVVSASATFVVCILVFLWFCRRIKKTPKRSVKTRSILKGSQRKNSVNKKVTFNPDMDLFDLNTLDFDLEQHGTCEPVNALSNKRKVSGPGSYGEKKESKQMEIEKSDNDDSVSRSSSTNGVIYFHDNVEPSIDDDKIVPVELHSHSTDEDSFHSVCDSHSSVHDRLSNASASSFTEALTDNISPYELDEASTRMDSAANLPKFISPPPPPPPPFFPTISSSARSVTKSSHSLKSTKMTSVMNSSALPASNQILQTHLPSHPSNPSLLSAVPPPAPPPKMKTNQNTMANPPPLPSQLTPLGKDGTPLPRLKPLHWDKVRAAPDRSMVWDKLRSSSFEFDEEMMESLFGYTLQKSTKNDEAKSKSPSPSKHVLDPQRLQNITILSKALNVTVDQVCAALVQGKGLCLQELEALSKMVPTKEEEDKLYSYEGNINHLGSAEKFLKAMLDVPYAFSRIEAMLFKETFEDEVTHLRNSFSMLEDACKELRSSRLFLKLLEAVLKTGNRMNIGTIRGGASAFRLDTLLKLSDVKGTDGKTTLLHFVVQEMIRSEGIKESETIVGRMNQRRKTIEEREEDNRKLGLDLVSGLGQELSNVKKTATVDLDVLSSSVSNLANGIFNLQTLLQEEEEEEEGGGFVGVMRSFGDYAAEKLKRVREDERQVLIHVREITEYFHGSVSKDEANPLRIFVIVRDFLGVLDGVCKEIRTSTKKLFQ